MNNSRNCEPCSDAGAEELLMDVRRCSNDFSCKNDESNEKRERNWFMLTITRIDERST